MPQFDPIVRVSTDLTSGATIEWDDNLTDRILEFEFTDKGRGADEAKLTFHNADGSLLDDSRLAPDARLVILYGYPHLTRTVRLTIKKVEGFFKLAVKGPANGAANFLGSQKTRSFDGATEWEVAGIIADELGYTGEDFLFIDSGDQIQVRRGISQVGETDWAFLTRLADRVDCVVYVRDDVFHFHAPSVSASPTKLLTFFDDGRGQFLEPPNIEYGVIGRAGRSEVRGVSTEEREEVRGEASNSTDTQRPALGDALAVAEANSIFDSVFDQEVGFRTPHSRGSDEGQMSIDPGVCQTPEEAQRQARRNFRGSERESVKLEGKLVGDPELIADETVRIEGIGQRFSGNYLLDEVVHNFSPAYTAKIKSRRNAVSRSSRSALLQDDRDRLTQEEERQRHEDSDPSHREQRARQESVNARVNNAQFRERTWGLWPGSVRDLAEEE